MEKTKSLLKRESDQIAAISLKLRSYLSDIDAVTEVCEMQDKYATIEDKRELE